MGEADSWSTSVASRLQAHINSDGPTGMQTSERCINWGSKRKEDAGEGLCPSIVIDYCTNDAAHTNTSESVPTVNRTPDILLLWQHFNMSVSLSTSLQVIGPLQLFEKYVYLLSVFDVTPTPARWIWS